MAMAGPMMGIFGGVCVLFIICGCVMVQGVPACCGGDPSDGVGSSTPPGQTGQATSPNTTSPVELAAANSPQPAASAPSPVDMSKPAYPQSAPMQPVVVGAAPPLVCNWLFGDVWRRNRLVAHLLVLCVCVVLVYSI